MSNFAKYLQVLSKAAAQGGYFTTQQARAAGYGYDDQHYHVAEGHWQRVARGLYRLRGFPESPEWDLIEVSLLSSDRAGVPQLVFSHETALRLHELSEINPARLSAIVPPGFRKHLPAEVQLHHDILREDEWEARAGYRVTTPRRTLLDIAASKENWPYLEEAVRDALGRGLVRRSELEQAEGTTRMRARMRTTLRRVEQPPERQKVAY